MFTCQEKNTPIRPLGHYEAFINIYQKWASAAKICLEKRHYCPGMIHPKGSESVVRNLSELILTEGPFHPTTLGALPEIKPRRMGFDV